MKHRLKLRYGSNQRFLFLINFWIWNRKIKIMIVTRLRLKRENFILLRMVNGERITAFLIWMNGQHENFLQTTKIDQIYHTDILDINLGFLGLYFDISVNFSAVLKVLRELKRTLLFIEFWISFFIDIIRPNRSRLVSRRYPVSFVEFW